MGGKTSTQTSTQTNDPWSEQKPYLQDVMKQAQTQFNSSGPSYYPKSTVAGFNPQQEQAFSMTANRAMNGNANMNAASGYNKDVINGQYMQNPNNDAVFRNISSHVTPQVNAQFSQAGRYGSDAHTGTMTQELTNAYAPYAAQQYEQGMQRRDNAAQMAPTFAANDYIDAAALGDVGQQRQDLAQQEIGDAQARWNYNQDLAANKLAQYSGAVGGNWGGTTTSAQPYYKPGLGSKALGGISALAGLFG